MFEPLSDNYEDYEWGLAQYFGYGVQACYRGFRYVQPLNQTFNLKHSYFALNSYTYNTRMEET